jgi:hypothetical protein
MALFFAVVLFTGSVMGFALVSWWCLLLLLECFICRIRFADCRGSFDLFSSTVCLLFWILAFWFVFRSIEICRDQSFQFCICGAREFGKADDSSFG